MADVTIRVSHDADRLLRALARNQMEGLAKVVGTDARRLCPVRTGDLVSTVDVYVDENSDIIGKAGDESKGIDYARHVEEGTYRQMAQPFMRPAFERRRGTV